MDLPGSRPLARALACACALVSLTSSAGPLSIEDLFKKANVLDAALSPDGKSVAMRAAVGEHIGLAVLDIDSGKIKEVAEYGDADVLSYRWVGNKRLVYSLTYLFDEHSSWTGFVQDGLFTVNSDGSGEKELNPTASKQIAHNLQELRYARPIAAYDDKPDLLLASQSGTREKDVTPIVINMVTASRHDLELSVTGEVHDFWADHANVIRLATTASTDPKHRTLWYRDGEAMPWRKLADIDNFKPAFAPLAFDADNKTLFVVSSAKNGKHAIYKYDFAKNAVGDLVFSDPDSDVTGGLAFTDDTHRLLGIRYLGDLPGVHWFDERRAGIQQAIDQALPGQINIITGDDHSAGLLIRSYADVDPGTYYYYDLGTHKLRKLFAARPWIKGDDLSPQAVFHYSARDGLDIPAYLTLPKGRPAKKLPLIVLVHGGPWMRDYWGFDPEVQFLASRGYAVLQPEYRGSSGYGFDLFSKGWKQWGLTMQDDITDGVQNLVKQGAVDAKRICIMGASYGGYAALMGAAKDPDQYRCAIDLFGVTDLELQMKLSDWRNASEEYRNYDAKELLNDPATYDLTSPLKQANRIKVPILMAYGAKDNRVPMEEGEKMRDVLKAQGKTVEWMVLEGEGHGIRQMANDQKLYQALEAFLNKYNPAD
jgi:dipeptidyl aminopeptidase/acylaminoacyl peptidase